MIIDQPYRIVLVGYVDTTLWFNSVSDDSSNSGSDSESEYFLEKSKPGKSIIESVEKESHHNQTNLPLIFKSASSSSIRTTLTSDEEENNIFSDADSTQCHSKWCVCDKGYTCLDASMAKMCKLCNQWYHLTCIEMSQCRIEQMSKNSDLDLICPVCNKDQEFIMKYAAKIKYRESRYQLVISSEETSNDTYSTNQLVSPFVSFEKMNCDEENDDYSNMPKSKKQVNSVGIEEDEEVMPKPRKLIARSSVDQNDELAVNIHKKTSIKLIKNESRKKTEVIKSNSTPVSQTKLIEPPENPKLNKNRTDKSIKDKVIVYSKNKITKEIPKPNMKKCIQCCKLVDKYDVPKEAYSSVYAKNEGNLKKNWSKSLYCDHLCINAYVSKKIEKIKNDLPDRIVLVNNSDKQKKEFNTLDLCRVKIDVSLFIMCNPTYTFKNMNAGSSSSDQSKVGIFFKKQLSRPDDYTATKQEQTKKVTYRSISVQEKSLAFEPKTMFEDLTRRFNELSNKQKIDNKIQNVNIKRIAKNIEEELKKLPTTKSQNTYFRIRKNLKNQSNQSFFIKILNGKIKPNELMSMTAEEMGDEKVKAENAKVRKEDLEGRIKGAKEWNENIVMDLGTRRSKGEEWTLKTSRLDLDSVAKNFESKKSSIGPSSSVSSVKTDVVVSKKTVCKKIPEPILFQNIPAETSNQEEFLKSPKNSTIDTTEGPLRANRLIESNFSSVKQSSITEDKKSEIKKTESNVNEICDETRNDKLVEGQDIAVLPVQFEYTDDSHNLAAQIEPENPLTSKKTTLKYPSTLLEEKPLEESKRIQNSSLGKPPIQKLPSEQVSVKKYVSSNEQSLQEPQMLSQPVQLVSHDPKLSFKTPQILQPLTPQQTLETVQSNEIRFKCTITHKDVYAESMSHSFSANIFLVPPVGQLTANQKFFLDKMLPTSLIFLNKHFLSYKLNRINKSTFYHYIDHLIEKHDCQPVFVNLKSAGGKDAKQIRETLTLDITDDQSYQIFLQDNFNHEMLISYQVPIGLREKFSHFYILKVDSKTFLNEQYCPSFKSKYSILLSRAEKQIIGIFIDIKSEESFKKNEILIWRYSPSTKTSSPHINQSPNEFAKPAALTNKRKLSTEKHPEEPENKLLHTSNDKNPKEPHFKVVAAPSDPRLKSKMTVQPVVPTVTMQQLVESLLIQVQPYLLLSEIELNDFLTRFYAENSVPVDSQPNCFEYVVLLKNYRKEMVRKEQLEKARVENEKLEADRLENERLNKDRAEKAKIENERLLKEKAKKEKIEKERIEKERIEKERIEKERIEKERIEKERIEKERIEKERIEKERIEKERIEKEKIEKEKIEKERIEKERIEKERIEKERIEKEKLTQQPSTAPARILKASTSTCKSILATSAVNSESSFFYINKILKDNLDKICEFDYEDNEDHKKCKIFLEQIISHNIGTPQDLTESQIARLRKDWAYSAPDFMYLLEFDRNTAQTSKKILEDKSPNSDHDHSTDIKDTQGESVEAFKKLLKLSQDHAFVRDNYNLKSTQFDLNDNTFIHRFEDKQLSPVDNNFKNRKRSFDNRKSYFYQGQRDGSYDGYSRAGGGGYYNNNKNFNNYNVNKYSNKFRNRDSFMPDRHTYIP